MKKVSANELYNAQRKIDLLTDLLKEVVDFRFLCCGTLAPLDEWDDLIRRIKEATNGNSNKEHR